MIKRKITHIRVFDIDKKIFNRYAKRRGLTSAKAFNKLIRGAR